MSAFLVHFRPTYVSPAAHNAGPAQGRSGYPGPALTLAALLCLILSIVCPFPLLAQNEPPVLPSPAGSTLTTVDNYPPLGIPDHVCAAVPGATKYRI